MTRTALAGKVRSRVARALREDTAARNRADDRHFEMVLAATLAPDATAVDVGAHRGTMLSEILRVAPAGRHMAFEALPDLAAGLRRDFPTVDVREVALADESGEASFVHALDEPGYSGLREREYPGETRTQTITVRTARLDDEIDNLAPALIKIDVEGGELGVLRGAVGTLERCRPVVWSSMAGGRQIGMGRHRRQCGICSPRSGCASSMRTLTGRCHGTRWLRPSLLGASGTTSRGPSRQRAAPSTRRFARRFARPS